MSVFTLRAFFSGARLLARIAGPVVSGVRLAGGLGASLVESVRMLLPARRGKDTRKRLSTAIWKGDRMTPQDDLAEAREWLLAAPSVVVALVVLVPFALRLMGAVKAPGAAVVASEPVKPEVAA